MLELIKPTPAEKDAINEMARSVNEAAFNAICAIPDDRRSHLRPLIIVAAIGLFSGPWQSWEEGIDALIRQPKA